MAGGGHCSHGHHGAGMMHHPDQSPSWNMAIQAEGDPTKVRGIIDPRIMIGLTFLGFVALVSLPYTLDYLQNQYLSGKPGAIDDGLEGSKGPSTAALSMIGATLGGGGVSLQDALMQGSVSAPGERGSAVQSEEPDNAQSTQETDQSRASEADLYNPTQAASESAQNTVSQMLSASGLYGAGTGMPINSPAERLPASGAMPYGINAPAVQPMTVYVPNRDFGQPEVLAAKGTAPGQFSYANPQQVSAQAYSAGPQLQRYSQPRSAFNPQTSAIVSPIGMRHLPEGSDSQPLPSSQSNDGGRRYRVFVSR